MSRPRSRKSRHPRLLSSKESGFLGDHVKVRRIIEGGYQVLKLPIRLISIAPTATPARHPSLAGAVQARTQRLKSGRLTRRAPFDRGFDGFPDPYIKVVDIQKDRPPVNMISGHTGRQLTDGLVSAIEDLKNRVADESSRSAPASGANTAVAVEPDSGFPKVDFRNGARGVMTWVEMHGQTPARSSLEILSQARKLADQLGTKVRSVMIGHDIKGAAREIIEHGADEVVIVDDPRLKEYTILPTTTALSQIIEHDRPEIALFGATTSGRELAPRLASRVRAGVTADCTSLEVGDYVHRIKKAVFYPVLQSIRPTYGESKLATIIGFWCPQMATARAGTFKILPRDPSRKGTVTEFKPVFKDTDFKVEVLETRVNPGRRPCLSPILSSRWKTGKGIVTSSAD